jgi:His-Xaa-Ser system protein HxsD
LERLFDTSAYPADAIQRAAYKYCDQFSLELTRNGNTFRCTLSFLDDSTDIEAIAADFQTEVLDQVLRERIRIETEAARNVILTLAFSHADVTDDEPSA